MSKKNKRKKLDTEYVIFLMGIDRVRANYYEDVTGVMKLVHRSEMYKFYKENKSYIDLILIPMDDGLQYVILDKLPTKFDSLNISFDLYITSSDYYSHIALGKGKMGDYTYIYEKIHSYDIKCNDVVDFVRFVQSFQLMTGIIDKFAMPDDFSSDPGTFVVEKAAYEYTVKGRTTKDRVRTSEGNITSSLPAEDFIYQMNKLVMDTKWQKYKSVLHGVLDEDAIIIDPDRLEWSIIPDFIQYSRDYVDVIGDNMIVSVFSDYTGTCIFENVGKISRYSWCDSIIPSFGVFSFEGSACADDFDERCDSLFEFLLNKHGYDYTTGTISFKELIFGSLSNYVENYTLGMCNDASLADSILIMVNAMSILNVINIIFQKIIGCVVFGMLQINASFNNDEEDDIYCYLCEDLRMMQYYRKSLYDRFSKKLDMVITGDIEVSSYTDPLAWPF